ncbi:triphosphoribosyl-dephospho-CoA synthase [Chelativorans composti]|jgi:Triphosphoribosyl-dephospho-CoA synthetase|uniref:Triphosphoribosyl-dephospho-CoA synthase n=1 Tax=Chelativorans composti TaxID=768533 RepID=A0ABW5DER6_9HYPH|nr:triphosphoribosyl-dephospho-CoA synthase [bacterium SGD-2]
MMRALIEQAYRAACEAEIDALKPGNVHRFAPGHGMTVEHFLESARVTAPIVADPSLSLGERILRAVLATREAVATNTNLGILLLCVPLACAAERGTSDLQASVAEVLSSLDMDDTRAIFGAIVAASPGGLGDAGEHDVRDEPTTGILEAMAAAADRDMIARQYVNRFGDVFGTGLPALEAARAAGHSGMWPTIAAFMAFLASFEDSHILRKFGPETAARVRREAAQVNDLLARESAGTRRIEILLDFDRSLKERGLNPGTSADLTVATCFADGLGRLGWSASASDPHLT